MQTQDLLEKSKKLKSKADDLLQEMGESKEYWQLRFLESERWLLAKNIDKFQEDLMKQVEEARLIVSNPDYIMVEAHEFETCDVTRPLKRVSQYIFSIRPIKNYTIDLPAIYKMIEKKRARYLFVKTFEFAIEELKKEIMEGKKDNLLRDPVEKILYNSILTTPPPDRTSDRKSSQKKGISQYGYKRIPEPENVYKRIQEPDKNTG